MSVEMSKVYDHPTENSSIRWIGPGWYAGMIEGDREMVGFFATVETLRWQLPKMGGTPHLYRTLDEYMAPRPVFVPNK